MKKDKNDLRHLLNLSNKGELTRALTNTPFQYKRQKQYGQRRFYEDRNKYDNKPFVTPTPTKVTIRRNNSPTTKRKPVATPRNMKERTTQAKVLPERSSPLEARNLEIVRTRQAIRTGGNSRVTHDYLKTPVGGRLFRFRTAWKGAHYESVVKQGLSWSWNETLPPPEIIEQESSPEMDGMLVRATENIFRPPFLSDVIFRPPLISGDKVAVITENDRC